MDEKLLKELKERRDKLSGYITQAEYELLHPPPPIDYEAVQQRVDKVMAQERKRMLPRYRELLQKTADGSATFEETHYQLPHYQWVFRNHPIIKT